MRSLLALAFLAALPCTAQPVLVAESDPGTDDGEVSELIVFDGAIYFSGKGAGGTELWRYLPATETAERVTNLRAQSLKPNEMVELGGLLYFNGNDDDNGRELWRFDPVTDEARLVADIAPGIDSGDPTGLTVFDGDLYFRGITPVSLKELWRYDPDTDTAEQTPEIRADGSAGPIDLTPLGPYLYFRAFGEGVGDELWRHDPVANTNTLVVDILSGEPSAEPRHIVAYGGRLYFFARSSGDAPWEQFWTFDPVTETASKVTDIPAGAGEDWQPGALFLLGDDLYFFAGSADGADDLWRHRPATGVTELVADLPPGNDDRQPFPVAQLDGILFFAASADGAGRELWQYDPGTDVVSRVTDINPGAASSNPIDFVAFDGDLYFGASDGVHGRELWKYSLPPVANEEIPDLSGVGEIAPNPATGTARLAVSLEAPGEVRLTVLDALGREVARETETLAAGGHDLRVPVAGLAPGTYTVRVEAPGGIASRRLTIIR